MEHPHSLGVADVHLFELFDSSSINHVSSVGNAGLSEFFGGLRGDAIGDLVDISGSKKIGEVFGA